MTIGIVLSQRGQRLRCLTCPTPRQRVLTAMLDHRSRLDGCTTLSVADAAAATRVHSQARPGGVRLRYEQAITDASVAVTRALRRAHR